MKKVPRTPIEECDPDTMNPTGRVFHVPTPDACKNFETYLNDYEHTFYKSLSDVAQLQIRISADPFNALAIAIRSNYDRGGT